MTHLSYFSSMPVPPLDTITTMPPRHSDPSLSTTANTTSTSSTSNRLLLYRYVTNSDNTTANDYAGLSQDSLNASSLFFLLGIFAALFFFTLVRIVLIDGVIERRQTMRETDERKSYIRNSVVLKTVLKKSPTIDLESGQEEEVKREIVESPSSLTSASSSSSSSLLLPNGSEDDNVPPATSNENIGQELITRPPPPPHHHHHHHDKPIYRRQKTNLVLFETTDTTNTNDTNDNIDQEDGSTSACPICLSDFQVGEEICWSHNPNCYHAFHMECIEPWLMKHDRCPCCRNKYLVEPPLPPPPTPPMPNDNANDGSANEQVEPSPRTMQTNEFLLWVQMMTRVWAALNISNNNNNNNNPRAVHPTTNSRGVSVEMGDGHHNDTNDGNDHDDTSSNNTHLVEHEGTSEG